MFEETNPFEGMRHAALVQQDPQERNRDPLIGDRQHKNINIHTAKFPIGAVETQEPLLSKGQPLDDSGGHLCPG